MYVTKVQSNTGCECVAQTEGQYSSVVCLSLPLEFNSIFLSFLLFFFFSEKSSSSLDRNKESTMLLPLQFLHPSSTSLYSTMTKKCHRHFKLIDTSALYYFYLLLLSLQFTPLRFDSIQFNSFHFALQKH
jgi:hypothetical protein